MKLSGNKILITGGASGIGLGLAEMFLKENNTVVICGRRESLLKEVSEKHPSIISKVCDLSKAEERENLFTWISKEHSDLNVLANNAGIQQWMTISDENFFKRAKDEIAINVEAPVHLISLFVRLKSLNTIINVTLALAYVPMIAVPVYSATKSFFHSFSTSVNQLMKNKNIEVIEIIPPAVNTDLGGKGIHDYAPPVSEFIDSVCEQLKAGKQEITFGYSAGMVLAGPEDLKKSFIRMNKIS